MTPEEQMAAAIAASLADLEEEGVKIASWTDEVDRGSVAREDEHRPDNVSQGKVTQVIGTRPFARCDINQAFFSKVEHARSAFQGLERNDIEPQRP